LFPFESARKNLLLFAAHLLKPDPRPGLAGRPDAPVPARSGRPWAKGGRARSGRSNRGRLLLPPILIAALAGCGGGETLSKNDLPVHCLEEPKAGPCHSRIEGYFYDYRYDRCRPFQYGGCDGNVPFKTLQECEEACVAGTK